MGAALGDVYRVRLVCSIDNQASVNVSHWAVKQGGGGGGATDQEIADAMSLQLGGLLRPCLTSKATFLGATAQRIHPMPPLNAFISTAGQGAGMVGANALPKQVSGLISLRTNNAGRKYRGRMYVPFPGEEDSVDVTGSPTNDYATRVLALGNKMVTGVTTSGAVDWSALECVIYHRSSLTWDQVTSCRVRSKWATQRRRGDYGRPNSVLIL